MALQSLPEFPDRLVNSFLQLSIAIEKILHSVEHAPKLDLKELPGHLKYAYLGENQALLVTIASDLTMVQEEKLLRVLRDFKNGH